MLGHAAPEVRASVPRRQDCASRALTFHQGIPVYLLLERYAVESINVVWTVWRPSKVRIYYNKIFHQETLNKKFLSILGDATLIDPVIDEYERHGGSITCIKCSPLRNLFVSSATDKEIRIYNLDEVNLYISHFNISDNHNLISWK